jgi:hypothetical protein
MASIVSFRDEKTSAGGPDADLGSGRENAAVGAFYPIRLRADQSGILIGALG